MDDASHLQAPLPSRWPPIFRALSHRNFALFWSGQLISLTGTWMQSVAQGWLAQQLATRDYGAEHTALALGLVGAAGSAPMLLLTLFAGVAADRWNRKHIVVATQTSAMLLAFALAALAASGQMRLWHLAVLAALLGTVNAFDMPARQSMIKDLVGPRDLMNAIALNSSIFNGARILGPAVAGVLLSLPGLGIPGVFAINGASYLAVIAGLLAMTSLPRHHTPAASSVWVHLREGLRYAAQEPIIRLLLILMGVFSIFGFSYFVLLPVIAGQVLGLDQVGFAWLVSSGGIGALAGALLLAALSHRLRPGRVLLVSGTLFSLALLALSVSSTFLTSAISLGFVGGAFVVTSATINNLIQRTVPDHLRGRIIALWTFIFAGFVPFGSLYAGMTAHALSPGGAIGIGAGVCGVTIGLVALRARWIRHIK